MCAAQSHDPKAMGILLSYVDILIKVLMTRGLAGSHTTLPRSALLYTI